MALQAGKLGAYIPPRWSSAPVPEEVHGLRFEVIRDGVALGQDETVYLDNRPFTILGRQPDVCHAHVLHPSISRQHIAVQHGPSGAVFIYDMGTTHGTKLNKKVLTPGQFLPLRVGDVVQLGQSSRIYCVEGPERLRPPEWQTLHAPLAPKPPTVRQEENQGEHRSDGDESDYPSEDEEDDDIDDFEDYLIMGSSQHSSLTAKQQKIVEGLNKKRVKMMHITSEAEILQTKESINGSLTNGQRAAQSRCQEQIASLQKAIDEQTEGLMARLKEKRNSHRKAKTDKLAVNKKVKRKKNGKDSDEDDDFYDRTAICKKEDAKRRKQAERVETLDSLRKQQNTIIQQEISVQEQIELIRKATDEPSVSTHDSLDEFMTNMNQGGSSQELQRLSEQLSTLNNQRQRLEKLIKIATPAGSHLVASTDWANLAPKPAAKPAPSAPKFPVPQSTAKTSAIAETVVSAPENILSMLVKPETTIAPETVRTDSDTYTLHGIDQALRKGGLVIPVKKAEVKRPERPAHVALENRDQFMEEWVPPSQQTGDGRTRLNEKFGY